jgi:hypothetical protein
MLKLLLYGYTTGVRSSRKIEKGCHDDVAFRFLSANAAPDFRSVARFRKRHLAALGELFLQALALCQKAGMVKMGRVALDGTKVKANASRHKAMSYSHLVPKEQQLQDEVDQMMADAERIDDEEDVEHGPDNRGNDLQDEMARRESRLAKIRRAKADIEQVARDKAAANAREKAEKAGKTESEADAAAKAAGDKAEPEPKAQRNFTDPDARIMKTADGSYHYCYNPQAVVDEENQVIVATDFAESSADSPAFEDMLDQTIQNTGQVPDETLADAGYFSEENVKVATQRKTDPLIAPGRLKHGEEIPDAQGEPLPEDATPKQKMAAKLQEEGPKAAYSRRKVIVEPVFGQMKNVQNAGKFLLRGRENAKAEWRLHAGCHNFRKLFGKMGTAKIATA